MDSIRRFSALIGLAAVLALMSGHGSAARSLMTSCEKGVPTPQVAAAACLELLSDPSLSVEDKVTLLRWRISALKGMSDQEIALIAANQWLTLQPDRAEPLRIKARLLHDVDATQSAYDLIDEAIAAFPDDLSLVRTRFDFLTRDKRRSEAMDLAEQTIRSHPDRPEGWGMRGLARLGEIGNVLQDIKTGKSFAQDQRAILAAADFQKAFGFDNSQPDYVRGFFNACVLLTQNCPSLFGAEKVVRKAEMTCDVAHQEAVLWVEKWFTLENTGFADEAEAEEFGKVMIAELKAGEERALRAAIGNYVSGYSSVTTYMDVDAARRVILFDRLRMCLMDEFPGALDLALIGEPRKMFDILFHHKLRENLLDLAYHALQADRTVP